MKKLVTLPLVLRPLDLENVTQPVPTVTCPVRNELMTVGNCKQCRVFRGVADKLCCAPGEHRVRRGTAARQALEVRDVLRVPPICAASDTALSTVLPYLEWLGPTEVIPVLDRGAKPIGVMVAATLKRISAQGIAGTTPLMRVMCTRLAIVPTYISLHDASRLRPDSEFRGAIAVADDDTFLGVVFESDLEPVEDTDICNQIGETAHRAQRTSSST